MNFWVAWVYCISILVGYLVPVCVSIGRRNGWAVELGEFRSQLEASNVSSHREELWYNETANLRMKIYVYIFDS